MGISLDQEFVYAKEKDAQEKIKTLVSDEHPIEVVFAGIEKIFQDCEEESLFITKFRIDFTDDFKVDLEMEDTKPESWSSANILDLLARIMGGLTTMRLLVGAITLSYGKPVSIDVVEFPDEKYTAFDLKEPSGSFPAFFEKFSNEVNKAEEPKEKEDAYEVMMSYEGEDLVYDTNS